MAEPQRETWITGIGLVSSLGEGVDAHWQAMSEGRTHPDVDWQAPYVIHRIAAIDFDKQILKKGDQRQMEPWQRIGTYAAGLALDHAGLKGRSDILTRTDMIVAAGGGERDLAVDGAIMTGASKAAQPDVFINERLMGDLRPTLFLAQLSNLLAGNISIVHGVTGSSRTFMGEESAGFDAVRIARSRIAAGQSDIALVGGSYNSERPDLLMLYEFGGFPLKGNFTPVWERGPRGGFALGSLGAFLVLEAREHAEARGAKPVARLAAALSDRSPRRTPDDLAACLAALWSEVEGRVGDGPLAVMSGATGAEPATSVERAFFAQHPSMAARATGTFVGHSLEPQFVLNIGMAALAVSRGSLFPSRDASGVEQPMTGGVRRALVTGVGHWRGEGLALVEAVD